MGAEAEDGDLAAGLGLEVVGAGCGDEDAVIGIDAGLNAEAMVFDQEVPQTGNTVEVERYRTGAGFEIGLGLKF